MGRRYLTFFQSLVSLGWGSNQQNTLLNTLLQPKKKVLGVFFFTSKVFWLSLVNVTSKKRFYACAWRAVRMFCFLFWKRSKLSSLSELSFLFFAMGKILQLQFCFVCLFRLVLYFFCCCFFFFFWAGQETHWPIALPLCSLYLPTALEGVRFFLNLK